MALFPEITDVPFVQAQETDFLIIGLREDGIMHLYMKAGQTLTLEGAMEAVEIVKRIGGGKAYPNLLDPQRGAGINKEARWYSKSEEANKYTLADAILVKSISHRILGNVYMNFASGGKPTKMFQNRDAAIAWLKDFLPQKP